MNKLLQADIEDPKNKADPTTDPGEKNWELINMKNQAVHQCNDWFEKDRMAKQPYNAEMDEMYKLFKSDHWRLLDETGQVLRTEAQMRNHPNSVENVTFAMIEGLVAEFAEPKELVDYPIEEGDDEAALIMTQLKKFIGDKNRLDAEFIKWLRWFFLYGTGIWQKTWDPTWKGGKGPNRWNGEVRWLACHPRTIFPDARCLESFQDGRRLHKAVYWTLEDVEETWPDAKGITPDSVSDDILVTDELEETAVEATEDQVLVIDTYYKGSPMVLEDDETDEGPGLHLIQWAGEGTLKYLAHENYVNFDPGEDVEFPINGYKCYERERSPWGVGEAYYLKNPQMMTNKTAELIIEGHIYQALGQTLFEETAVSEKQKRILQDKGTLGGMWFEVQNIDGIRREYPKNVPTTLENETNRLQKVMETIIGRFDISQGKTPGSITAFRALDLLNSRAQVRLRSKDMTINLGWEDSGNYINRLVSRNYNEKRKFRIMGKDENSKPTYGTYDADNMKKVYLFEEDETMTLGDMKYLTAGQEELPVQDQILEGKDYEVYSPEFDTRCKLTTDMPSDRVFYMEMAKELFSNQLIDVETFYYVIENGKFPPIKEVLKRLLAQQQPPPGTVTPDGTIPPGPIGPQPPIPGQGQMDPQVAVQQFIEMLKVKHPDILKQLAALPKEKQVPALLEMMRTMPPEMMEQVEGQPAVPMESNTEVPPQQDPEQLKKQLIDIILAQKEQYNQEELQQ